jgi:hypothetical protein
MDNGSQSDFISEELCDRLKLNKHKVHIPVVSINDQITQALHIVKVNTASAVDNSYHSKLNCLVLPKITGVVRNVEQDVFNLLLACAEDGGW